MTPPPGKPKDTGAEELEKGTKAWLYPRLIIGMLLLVAFAIWIYWPRA